MYAKPCCSSFEGIPLYESELSLICTFCRPGCRPCSFATLRRPPVGLERSLHYTWSEEGSRNIITQGTPGCDLKTTYMLQTVFILANSTIIERNSQLLQ